MPVSDVYTKPIQANRAVRALDPPAAGLGLFYGKSASENGGQIAG
jgi:hypothetical protein